MKAPCWLSVAGALLVGAASARGQVSPATQPQATAADYRDIGIVERLGNQVPLDVSFDTDEGEVVRLGRYFNQGRPVVLQLGYFACPRLCGEVSQGVVESLKRISFTAGKDYEFVYISINPSEGSRLAHLKKQSYVQAFGRPQEASGWHLLTGKQSHIRQVTEAVGFKYKWIEQEHQFVHPGGIIILSPEGRVSRYLGGIEFDPQTLRMSMVEAAKGKIGTVSDQIWLACFQYSDSEGGYVVAATRLMKGGAALTVLILGLVIFRLLRREFLRRREAPPSPGTAT